MNMTAQEWIVAAAVALAAAYVAWKWMPARWRARLGGVHPSLAASSGCGGCDSCGSSGGGGCATSPPQAGSGDGQPVVFHPPVRSQGAGASRPQQGSSSS
ncbi:hypothetical protein C8244_05135 [Paracidovorax avenae]|uniref:hypothetical protein n=1 Tax=Paracidovorax avenae TaxID=80867 RepID=UPI000D15C59C|nr:hypothetical protein [Paracidovorax avenae]AVS80433.1 hypothetical protein C8237_04570 [Paracidovorax avenae]AVT15671.1 hypothetical protein C8244_05135 [Paracidovorax avenae]